MGLKWTGGGDQCTSEFLRKKKSPALKASLEEG